MKKPIPVKIAMVAYNQEKYISQAIESVLMQKTNFSYQLVIGDDCSTDSTTQICALYAEKFPDKITFIYNNQNRGLLENYKQILDNHPAKYIAILEGDDYWTDENKLQLQFDLLENNPDIGLIHTDCAFLFESGKLKKNHHKRHYKSIKKGNVFYQLLLENYIRPVTVMFRQELYNKYISVDEYIRLGFKMIDYPMWLDTSLHTKFYYLNISTAVYRVHNSSVSHSNQYEKAASFFDSIFEIKCYALAKYELNAEYSNHLINDCLTNQVTIEMEFQKYENVAKIAKKIAVSNFRNLTIRIMSTNRFLIDMYSHYLKYRRNIQGS